jgi:hypothetical protein
MHQRKLRTVYDLTGAIRGLGNMINSNPAFAPGLVTKQGKLIEILLRYIDDQAINAEAFRAALTNLSEEQLRGL